MQKGRRIRAGLVLVALLRLSPFFGEDVREAGAQAFSVPLPIPPVRTEGHVTITMQEADLQILPGPKTRMWTYDGMFPGPTIRRPSGAPTYVTFVHHLPAEAGKMTVHHHGNHSASSEDGVPEDFDHSGPSLLIPPGGSRTYTYELMEAGEPERAAFQWYHDHRMDVTARNVWMGLAGMVIIDDEVDAALPLPKGEFDVPLMIVSRKFDGNNQIPYTNGEGDVILVNGASRPYLEVAARKYRFRILNAANRQIYSLSLSDGRPMVQIATESGLLPAPVTRETITLAPAERVEAVVDFAGELGETITLRHGEGSLQTEILQFRVTREAVDDSSVPEALRALPVFDSPSRTRLWFFSNQPAVDASKPVNQTGGLSGRESNPHLVETINGQPFDHHRVDACPRLNSTEKWIFIANRVPALGQAHVVHIHDVDWLMLRRNQQPPEPHEAGLKETFYLPPGDVVEVVSKFTDHLGRYLIHCHMLEHEDNAMMATFEVVPAEGPLPSYCPPDLP